MSSLSSISAVTNYSAISGVQHRHRPDPEKMAEKLFANLDTSGKGYIEQSDLASALSGLTSASSSKSATSSGASASDIFSQLDSDGDGKVTKDEFSTSIKKLAEALDGQFNQSRMEGSMPPPPAGGPQGSGGTDTGFTKDEFQSQLSEIGSSDTKRSSLLSNIVNNFDKADTNSDGKVSFLEAMAYDQATSSSASTTADISSTASTESSGTSSSTQASDAQVFRQLMELMRSYGSVNDGESSLNALSSLISTTV